jgi:uroporphyrinogen-III synthase
MANALTAKTLAIFSTPANKKIVSRLRAAPDEVIEFPFVEAEKIELNAAQESFITNVSGFDWIIFPDVYAVEFFLEAMEKANLEFFELDSLRILAGGEAVADRLRFVRIHADVIPARLDAESVFTALRDYLFDGNEFDGLRILMPREASFETELTGLLRARRAEVAELAIYRLKTENAAGLTRLKTLLKGGAVDEFIFTSPADVSNLAVIFREKLKDLLAGTSVSATDETTFQTLREYELRPLYFKKN